MATREVSRGISLPVGGSVGADSGSVPNPSGIDHVHSFWGVWYEIPIFSGYSGTVYFSMCGNMVWVRGNVTKDVSVNPNQMFARIHPIARPDRTIYHESYIIRKTGYMYVSGYGWSTDDMMYRTISQ